LETVLRILEEGGRQSGVGGGDAAFKGPAAGKVVERAGVPAPAGGMGGEGCGEGVAILPWPRTGKAQPRQRILCGLGATIDHTMVYDTTRRRTLKRPGPRVMTDRRNANGVWISGRAGGHARS